MSLVEGILVLLTYSAGVYVLNGRVQAADKERLIILVCCFSPIELGVHVFQRIAYGATMMDALLWTDSLLLTAFSAYTDGKERIIPNELLLVALAFGALFYLAGVMVEHPPIRPLLISSGAGVLAGAGVYLIARIITRGGVGFGDVKLFGTLGLLLGFRGVLNVMLYAMLGAFVVSVFQLIAKRKSLNDELPLAPFALLGVALSIAFGV